MKNLHENTLDKFLKESVDYKQTDKGFMTTTKDRPEDGGGKVYVVFKKTGIGKYLQVFTSKDKKEALGKLKKL